MCQGGKGAGKGWIQGEAWAWPPQGMELAVHAWSARQTGPRDSAVGAAAGETAGQPDPTRA